MSANSLGLPGRNQLLKGLSAARLAKLKPDLQCM